MKIDNEFEIGQVCKDSECYGTVTVMDIFTSVTDATWFCYRVEDVNGTSFLANEEELFPASPPALD